MSGKPVETTGWNGKKSVFAFYQAAGGGYSDLDGFVFIPTTGLFYEKVAIGTIGQEGDTPKVEALFFANADKDAAKEIVIICSFHQQHLDVNGTLYATYVYDNIAAGKHPDKLTFLEKVSDKVSGGCDCQWNNDKKMKANKKNETAVQVKASLKKLGY